MIKSELLIEYEKWNEIEFIENNYGEYEVVAENKNGIVEVAKFCILNDIEFRIEPGTGDLLVLESDQMEKLNQIAC